MSLPLTWVDVEEVQEYGELIPPRSLKKNALESYAITIPLNYEDTQTLTYAYWDKHTHQIVCDNDSLTKTALKCIALDIAYDQVNRLNMMWVDDGALYLYWYNTLTGMFETTNFGVVTQAFFLMDDWRHHSQADSTLMLFYVKDSILYTRLQLDRFAIEYTIATLDEDSYVRYIGMSSLYRLQIALGNADISDLFPQIIQVDDSYVLADNFYVGENI